MLCQNVQSISSVSYAKPLCGICLLIFILPGAIFYTLNKLLEKIPLAVKPFLPQLQRTFARGLADTTSETLRNRAAKGLGILITLTPRVDPLIAGKSREVLYMGCSSLLTSISRTYCWIEDYRHWREKRHDEGSPGGGWQGRCQHERGIPASDPWSD